MEVKNEKGDVVGYRYIERTPMRQVIKGMRPAYHDDDLIWDALITLAGAIDEKEGL